MILTKKDFRCKYIKLPKNISKRKFNKIKNKFKRLGFYPHDILFNYDRLKYGFTYICQHWAMPFFGIFDDCPVICREVSIKEFLKEPKKENKLKDEEVKKIILPNYYIESFEIDANKWKIDEFNHKKNRYVFKKRNKEKEFSSFKFLIMNNGCIKIFRKISSLDEENYILKKPFVVTIELNSNGKECSVSLKELGIVCWDKDENEAIKEVKKEILDLYDDLVLDPRWELGKKPKRWQKILKEHIQYKKRNYEITCNKRRS